MIVTSFVILPSILGQNHSKKEHKIRAQRHSPSASGKDSKKMNEHSVPFVRAVVGTAVLMQSRETKIVVNYESIDLVVAEVWLRPLGRGIKKQDMECIENYNKQNGTIYNLLILICLLDQSKY